MRLQKRLDNPPFIVYIYLYAKINFICSLLEKADTPLTAPGTEKVRDLPRGDRGIRKRTVRGTEVSREGGDSRGDND